MKTKLKLPIKTYLIYLILVAVLITGTSFSRYTVTLGGQDSITMAKYVFYETLNDDMDSKVLDYSEIQPGGSINYQFKVSNSNGVNITDIAIEFYIVVTVVGDLPLEFTLSEGAPVAAVYTLDTETNTITTAVYDLGITELQEYEFNLFVNWDAMYDDPMYETLTTTVSVEFKHSPKREN